VLAEASGTPAVYLASAVGTAAIALAVIVGAARHWIERAS
jgi:hypothetical protein